MTWLPNVVWFVGIRAEMPVPSIVDSKSAMKLLFFQADKGLDWRGVRLMRRPVKSSMSWSMADLALS
jgi:hypothetical protein